MKIIFWERTVGAKFPDFNSEMEVSQKDVESAESCEPSKIGDMELSFSDRVHDNGFWVKKTGQPGCCRVTVEQ